MDDSRHYANTLSPYPLSQSTTSSLHTAINTGLSYISKHAIAAAAPEPDKNNTLYSGTSGIALALLRLSHQTTKSTSNLANADAIAALLPRLHHQHHSLRPGHLAPLGSPTGPAMVSLLLLPHHENIDFDVDVGTAMATIGAAVRHAIASDKDVDGDGDEVLYGRAGLLWGLLNMSQDEFRVDAVGPIVDAIVRAGRRGCAENGVADDNEEVLMWKWHEKFYLGAIHGAAGILTVLLQCPSFIIEPYMSELTATIRALCNQTLKNGGHLPATVTPSSHHDHASPLVQLCHGSPGLVLLLTTFRRLWPAEWAIDSLYENTLYTAAKVVWEAGLLKKGMSLCHGVAGNGMVLLSIGEEEWTKKAVALMLQASKMPPLAAVIDDDDADVDEPRWRMPDRPGSLMEGVAGAIVAWSEAIAVLEDGKKLGVPGLGGYGPVGIL